MTEEKSEKLQRAFDFLKSLNPAVYELLGYPTMKMGSDYVEVSFDCIKTIRNLDVLNRDADEFRMFTSDTPGVITIVYTFYLDED